MPYIRHQAALAAVVCALASCQQTDQQLPFELDGGGQTISIGPTGGLISVPPDLSIEFPPSALATAVQVTAAERLAAFPNDAGALVPISSYDIGPAGTSLLVPAHVQLAVPPELLDSGDELSLALALLTPGGDVITQVTSYDLNNGFLTADIAQLGPIAAVVASDAIDVLDIADVPALNGGSFAPPAVSAPVGPARNHGPVPPGTVRFTASCSTTAQSCFSSGIVELFVDDVVRERFGEDIVLLNATVEAEFDFSLFVAGRPLVAYGYLSLDGELRARLNSVVAGRRAGDEVELFTGGGSAPANTAVSWSTGPGGVGLMTLTETSVGSPASLEYAVVGVGTSEQLTLQFEGDIPFSNPSPAPPDSGHVVVQVRLRR